jgi:hypothetical protein
MDRKETFSSVLNDIVSLCLVLDLAKYIRHACDLLL